MYMNRTISRVLAAAVASAGFVVPVPTIAASLSCTGARFRQRRTASGNINVSCTQAGTTSGTCSISVSPTVLSAAGGNRHGDRRAAAQYVAGRRQIGHRERQQQLDRQHRRQWPQHESFRTPTRSPVTAARVPRPSRSPALEAVAGTSPPPGGPISCAGFTKTLRPRSELGCAGNRGSAVCRRREFQRHRRRALHDACWHRGWRVRKIKSAEWGDQQTLRSPRCRRRLATFPTPTPLGTPRDHDRHVVAVRHVRGRRFVRVLRDPAAQHDVLLQRQERCDWRRDVRDSHCNVFIELQKPKGL